MAMPLRLSRAKSLRPFFLHVAVCAAFISVANSSSAQDALAEQLQLIKAPNAIAKIGTDLFGDSVNIYQGSLSFRQTDVSLRGNSAIAVQVGRKLGTGLNNMYVSPDKFAFGRWELDMPYMKGTFSDSAGWTVWGQSMYARCSHFSEPAPVSSFGGIFDASSYWTGNYMYIPGQGEQQLLARSETYLDAPNNAPASYPVVTSNKWAISCTSNLANDPGGANGEGFVAVSPDGVKYRFDQMVSFPVWSVTQAGGGAAFKATSSGISSLAGQSSTTKNKLGGGTVTPMAPVNPVLARKEVRLLVTSITDRFGNWVRYNYDPARPANVSSITSSDGRTISFAYGNASYPHLITSINDGLRTWSYGYASVAVGGYTLTSVTLPDASSWGLSNMYPLVTAVGSVSSPSCGGVVQTANGTLIGSMTHPSGATGTFTLTGVTHGRSDVPQVCRTMPNGSLYAGYPIYLRTYSLASKSISGPGMATMNWSYAYGPANASFAPCTGSCPTSKTTTVTDPKGFQTRYTFGNRYRVSEGRLEQVDVGWNGSTALSTTTTRYRAPGAGPYPAVYGYGGDIPTDGEMLSRAMPVDQKVTTQQGTTFTWTANSFDTGARVTSATKSSSLGENRTETTAYQNNNALWVLDQVTSITESSTGKAMVENTYNAGNAKLETTRKFGHLIESYSYAADGTLYTKADGKSQTTTFTNYKAGIPQNTSYPNGTSDSAVVTTQGYITSMTNAAGFTTSFGYDTMGRLASIAYPTGDTVAWNGTTILSERVAGSELGISGAHWRQTVSTGNARSITYYDGLLRPILNRTFDAASPSTTGTAVRKTFDHLGNTTFESYPLRDITDINTVGTGVTRDFDALNRPTTTVAASELGNLTTTNTYNSGFTTTVTNPRGKSTTYSYFAWDEPKTDVIKTIALPDSVNVTINRNAFANTTSIVRSRGGVSATRSYVYDDYERLCKTIEPEVGATVQDYDAANNIVWKATGQGLQSPVSCDTYSVPDSQKIAMAYDGLNRLTDTTFGDGSPSIIRTYTSDGLPYTTSSNGSTWTNTYNKRRLMERESLVFNGVTSNIDRSYDANGSLWAMNYPDGTSLWYTPDALGRATTVGSFANAIAYHPNGAISNFTYGNGITHSLTQNTRGLPRQSNDVGVLNDQYDYDANGNVSQITDLQAAATTRTMGYDDLDRLVSVAAPAMWGTASYGYDGLDNLTSSTVTGGGTARTSTHNIDALTNRLSSISSNNAAFAFNYGYDARGNITTRGSQSYVFDIGNRISNAPGKATYSYDGFGRRTLVAQTDGTNRRQVYGQDGKLYYANQTGGPNPSSTTKYIYIDNHLLAEVDSVAGTTYDHTDALGSPVARTNASRTVISSAKYEPYGMIQASAGSNGKIGFTGHVNDTNTGLTYMQQRYYDPVAGRFLSIDPVLTDMNTAATFNRYSYVNNNAYKYIDPDGRDILVITGGVRDGSVNLFGHTASAVQRNGMSSFGNDTAKGSSVTDYLKRESKVRVQQVTVLKTSEKQDAAAIQEIDKHADMSVGLLDNCAVRTNQVLEAAGIPVAGIPFPGGVARDAAAQPNAVTYTVPQNGEMPKGLAEIVNKFERPKDEKKN